MLAEDPDILIKLKVEAARLTQDKKESSKPLTNQVSTTEITEPEDVLASYHFGHALVK